VRAHLLATAALVLAVPATAQAAPDAHRNHHRPRADLAVTEVSGALAAGTVGATAVVKNKGKRKAGATLTTFRLSTDTVSDGGDLLLGSVATRGVKAKKDVSVSASFVLPAGTGPGSYHVVACADDGRRVREGKEANNCRASTAVVVVAAPPPPPMVTVQWAKEVNGERDYLGTVTATATGGSCTEAADGTGGSCRVLAGSGTVTLTAQGGGFLVFQKWGPDGSRPCTGQTSGSGSSVLTLSAMTTDQGCLASFYISI
jgi:hypothetical protein